MTKEEAQKNMRALFQPEVTEKEMHFLRKGVDAGVIISTEHGPVDDIRKRGKETAEHGDDEQWAAKEYLRKEGF